MDSKAELIISVLIREFTSRFKQQIRIAGRNNNLNLKNDIILQVISSTHRIDIIKFKEYAEETAKHFIKNYSWYYMPASVHKILIHGAEIIKYALLPIGQLTEEVLESSHKDFKKYRLKNTRKFSRLVTNEDLTP